MSIFLNSILESDELLDTDIDVDTDIDDDDEGAPLDTDINDGISIGEPLEEASMIMYESQANFNQLMMAIGMHELNEAAQGKKVAVFTEADVSGFFAKVKDTIKRMFERIVTAINEFLVDFGAKVRKDKDFILRYKAEIALGAKTDNWSIEGYKYQGSLAKIIQNYEAQSSAQLADLSRMSSADDLSNKLDIKKAKEEMLKYVADSNKKEHIKSISTAIDAMIKKYRGENTIELSNKDIDLNEIVSILTGDEFSIAKNSIRTIRESYKKCLEKLNAMEKNVKKDSSNKNKSDDLKKLSKYSDYVVFERNVCNSVYLAVLRMLRDRTNQARKIAHKCYQLGKSASTEKKAAANAAGFGESSLFNLDLI